MTSKSISSYYYFRRRVVDFRGTKTEYEYTRPDLGLTKTGNPVPGWVEKMKHKQDASSDYDLTRYNVIMGSYKASYRCVVGTESVDDTFYPNVPIAWPEPAALSTKVANTALGNFLSNAHDVVAPFKGLTFLGELKETLKMIRHPATALRNGIASYLNSVRHRKRHFRGTARNFSRTVAGTWLEYVYGWKPLISDIESAANAYAQHEADVEYLRAYGKAEEVSTSSSTKQKIYFASYGSYERDLLTRDTCKVVYKGVVRVRPEIQADAARNVMRLSGFGIEEFIPTAWELIPYSFVADYFSNIGTILNSATPLFYDWVWWSCATTRKRASVITISPGVKSSNSWSWNESIIPGTVEKVIYSRRKPVLSLPTPQLELPGSNWQWANLLALATQAVLDPYKGKGFSR